ncbi:MAG: hypothetical protein AAF334_05395 [Pseudomonadota bacterium]
MKSNLIPALLVGAVAVVGTVHDAEAMRRKVDTNKAYERRQEIKAAWAQSRAVGGYDDPITALLKVLRGEGAGKNIQPVITYPDTRGISVWKSR